MATLNTFILLTAIFTLATVKENVLWRVWVRRGGCRVLVGKPEVKRPLADLGVDEWMWDVVIGTGLGWPRIGTRGGRL